MFYELADEIPVFVLVNPVLHYL